MSGLLTRQFARQQEPGWGRGARRALCLATAALLSAGVALSAGPNDHPFRLAFSSSMFTEVNETDVRAAMKVWILTVARERGIPVDSDPNICRTTEELADFARANRVDGVGITTPEYERLSQEMRFDSFAAGTHHGSFTEEYVLLVRQDSGLDRLDQLRGRRISLLKNPRMSLALIWLDTILLEKGLDRASGFFGPLTTDKSAMNVILPVFFSKIDVAVVSRASLQVMTELNPQLNRQLKILAASPELVPSGFAFRVDEASPFRPQILEAMARLADSPPAVRFSRSHRRRAL